MGSGAATDTGKMNSLQTPKELGQEQTTKIISVYPSEGIIDSYS